MYTGNFQFLNEHNALKIMKAADRFELESLLKQCEKLLGNGLNLDNAIGMLILADLKNNEQLISKATQVVIEKIKDFKNVTLEKISKLNSNLVNETFKATSVRIKDQKFVVLIKISVN